MRHLRAAAASWQQIGLLQQHQETWHFGCIVPMSKMHFRDVTLMGLCFGRLVLARDGNFYVYQAKTWHQHSDNWLHLCKSVSVLLLWSLLSVCQWVFFLQIQRDFVSASHQGLLKRFLWVSSPPYPHCHGDWQDTMTTKSLHFRHGIKKQLKTEVMYPSCCTGIKGNFTDFTLCHEESYSAC